MSTIGKSLATAVLIWLMTVLIGSPLVRFTLYFSDLANWGPIYQETTFQFLFQWIASTLLLTVFSSIFTIPFILNNFFGLLFLNSRKGWKNSSRLKFIIGITTFISIVVIVLFNGPFGADDFETKMVNRTIGPYYISALISIFILRKRFLNQDVNKKQETVEESY